MRRSILLNHHLGRFDDSGDGVTLLELEFVSAPARDDAFNETVPGPDDNMGHDIAELNLFNLSA